MAGVLTTKVRPLIITVQFLLQGKGEGQGARVPSSERALQSVLVPCLSTATLNRSPGWATTSSSHQSCATAQAESQSPFPPQVEAGERAQHPD